MDSYNIDPTVKSQKIPFPVIPSRIVVRDDAQAGIQVVVRHSGLPVRRTQTGESRHPGRSSPPLAASGS